jgi:hypothetical protein
VFAQLEWRPGWDEPEYSYGGVKPGADLAENATQAADIGFSLIAEFQRRGGHRQAGSYAIENDEDYARLIYERIYDNPARNRRVKDALSSTIASWLSISESSIDRYRVRFGIGIRDIRRHRVTRPN